MNPTMQKTAQKLQCLQELQALLIQRNELVERVRILAEQKEWLAGLQQELTKLPRMVDESEAPQPGCVLRVSHRRLRREKTRRNRLQRSVLRRHWNYSVSDWLTRRTQPRSPYRRSSASQRLAVFQVLRQIACGT